MLYQTVEWTLPHEGRGSAASSVAPTVVPRTLAGALTGLAPARLSFGGGATAAVARPVTTRIAATAPVARSTRRRYAGRSVAQLRLVPAGQAAFGQRDLPRRCTGRRPGHCHAGRQCAFGRSVLRLA